MSLETCLLLNRWILTFSIKKFVTNRDELCQNDLCSFIICVGLLLILVNDSIEH